MKKIVIIGSVWVEPNSSASGSRMLQLIYLFLQNNYEITFATTSKKTPNAFNLKAIGVNEVIIELNNSSFDDFIKDLNPSVVVFDRFMIEEQFGWRVTENCPDSIKILDTEDLHSLRKVRYQAIKNQHKFNIQDLLTSDIAKREIAAILRSDVSLIISTYEMELLQNTFKIDASLLFHLPFLLNEINEAVIKKWKPFKSRNHFITIGNFLHQPNVDGVLQLKRHIWQHVRKKLPNAEIHVYGAYLTQQMLELHNEKEGFMVKGFTEDASKVVSDAKVLLAPLRFGAGIKGKLTEAMLHGTPSVTTTIGAEGMHGNLPWNGFIVNDTILFAEKAIELYTDKELWEKSQENGIKIINQLYNKPRLSKVFIDMLSRLQLDITSHRTHNFIGAMLHHQTLQSTKYMSKWIEEKNKD